MTEAGMLSPQQTFEQRVKDRLRDDIGDLIPQEVLDEMCKSALHDLFFKPRQTSRGTQPSWFEEQISVTLGAQMKVAMTEWLEKNPEFITEQVAKAVTQELPKMLIRSISEKLVGTSSAVSADMVEGVYQNLRNQGLNIYP